MILLVYCTASVGVCQRSEAVGYWAAFGGSAVCLYRVVTETFRRVIVGLFLFDESFKRLLVFDCFVSSVSEDILGLGMFQGCSNGTRDLGLKNQLNTTHDFRVNVFILNTKPFPMDYIARWP